MMGSVDAPHRDEGSRTGSTNAAARSPEHWLCFALGLAFPLGLVAARVFLDPDPRGFGTHEQLGLWPCRSMALFGIPCPGCGVTTSVALAVRGRFLDSLATQPFGTLAVLLGLSFSIWSIVRHLEGRDLHVLLRRERLTPGWIALGAALGLSWVYKLAVT